MKKATHFIAVGILAIAAFFATPAGHALLMQYSWLAPLSTLIGVGAVYFNPNK